MDGVSYFFWLAGQALEIALFFPPTAILTLVAGVSAFVLVWAVLRERWHLALVGTVIPLVLPVAILLCGVLLAYNTDLDESASQWPEWLVTTLLLAHLPLSAALIALLRGARWFALAMSVAIFGYSWGAAIMSTMSVSGRWL
jgi:uncharacterized protein YqgC (DUF456 family)